MTIWNNSYHSNLEYVHSSSVLNVLPTELDDIITESRHNLNSYARLPISKVWISDNHNHYPTVCWETNWTTQDSAQQVSNPISSSNRIHDTSQLGYAIRTLHY